MQRYDLDDTIAAIATPVGESGIGIVRMSGKEAFAIADKIFVSKKNTAPSRAGTFTVHYGWVREPSGASVIDEVILTVMRAPKTYTKEDVVEINCHGGITAMRRVLDAVLENGCRLAHPGEFTRRAFLNGRIDLAQAEAVLDVIRAKTDAALAISVSQLEGVLSRRIQALRSALLDVLSQLETRIEFPDEAAQGEALPQIARGLEEARVQIRRLLEGSSFGRVFREGLKVVICGRPNAGKSSLLNALLKQERSIVTAVAGTTRDTIEELVSVKGIPVRLMDTAGILRPRGIIEKEAVRRSRKHIDSADLVILVFDGSKRLTKDDEVLMRRLKDKPLIPVINKADLRQRINLGKIVLRLGRTIAVSAKTSRNLHHLEEAISERVFSGRVRSAEPVLVTNARHIQKLKQAQHFIHAAASTAGSAVFPVELVAQDVKDGLGHLDELLGTRFDEEVLDRIFDRFCIGK